MQYHPVHPINPQNHVQTRRRGIFSLAKPQSRKEKRRFSPAARPRLPIYFLGERSEGFEDVPILEPLKGTNWRQKEEAIRLLLQLGVPKAEITQKLGLSEEDIQRI